MAATPRSFKTIPVKPDTWARLRDYKMAGASYDDVLNELMDAVPLEKVSKRLLRLHAHRLKTFKGVDFRELREKVGGAKKPPRGRVPGRGRPPRGA